MTEEQIKELNRLEAALTIINSSSFVEGFPDFLRDRASKVKYALNVRVAIIEDNVRQDEVNYRIAQLEAIESEFGEHQKVAVDE